MSKTAWKHCRCMQRIMNNLALCLTSDTYLYEAFHTRGNKILAVRIAQVQQLKMVVIFPHIEDLQARLTRDVRYSQICAALEYAGDSCVNDT